MPGAKSQRECKILQPLSAPKAFDDGTAAAEHVPEKLGSALGSGLLRGGCILAQKCFQR